MLSMHDKRALNEVIQIPSTETPLPPENILSDHAPLALFDEQNILVGLTYNTMGSMRGAAITATPEIEESDEQKMQRYNHHKKFLSDCCEKYQSLRFIFLQEVAPDCGEYIVIDNIANALNGWQVQSGTTRKDPAIITCWNKLFFDEKSNTLINTIGGLPCVHTHLVDKNSGKNVHLINCWGHHSCGPVIIGNNLRQIINNIKSQDSNAIIYAGGDLNADVRVEGIEASSITPYQRENAGKIGGFPDGVFEWKNGHLTQLKPKTVDCIPGTDRYCNFVPLKVKENCPSSLIINDEHWVIQTSIADVDFDEKVFLDASLTKYQYELKIEEVTKSVVYIEKSYLAHDPQRKGIAIIFGTRNTDLYNTMQCFLNREAGITFADMELNGANCQIIFLPSGKIAQLERICRKSVFNCYVSAKEILTNAAVARINSLATYFDFFSEKPEDHFMNQLRHSIEKTNTVHFYTNNELGKMKAEALADLYLQLANIFDPSDSTKYDNDSALAIIEAWEKNSTIKKDGQPITNSALMSEERNNFFRFSLFPTRSATLISTIKSNLKSPKEPKIRHWRCC